MERYEINNNTLAVIACNDKLSRVYEDDNSFYVKSNSNRIMEESCEYFGSSLDGRRKGTEAMIGVNYKAPIIVEETNNLIFFPTSSIRNDINSWINFDRVRGCFKSGKDVWLEFDNDVKIKLPMSVGSLNNQILRAARLNSELRTRKSKKTF